MSLLSPIVTAEGRSLVAPLDRWALAMLRLVPGDTVLLSGTLAALARGMIDDDPSLALTVVDRSEARLAEARAELSGAEAAVRYLLGDLTSLRDDLGQVDAIAVSTATAPEPEAVSWGMLADLTARGGRLVVQTRASNSEQARCQLAVAGLAVERCETVLRSSPFDLASGQQRLIRVVARRAASRRSITENGSH